MGILATTLKASKFPLKLLAGWLRGKPQKRKDELREKQLSYVRNFDPTRLNNRSWQQRAGKKLTKKQRKYYKKKRKSKQRKFYLEQSPQ